jgi:c-di-GMP-binding flagellar brake protein YcgR
MSASSLADPADGLDTIGGKSLFGLFERLKEERTPLQLTVFGRNYERLSVVTGVKSGKSESCLLIDSPPRLAEDIPEHTGLKVKIEFLDKDRIQYAFRSEIVRVIGEDIWLAFPEYVERIQRRKHFRIAPPMGTKISFLRDGKPQEASVINLSEGGALLSFSLGTREGPKLWPGEEFRSLHLRCFGERVSAEFRVRKAIVKRAEKNPQVTNPVYAFQFLDMESKDKQALQVFIFQCQREMLQRRSFTEND